jgi:hypothetical protein
MVDLHIGQRLVCSTGEKVIIKSVTTDRIWVEYRGKIYKRPKSIIGTKLFFEKTDGQLLKPKVSQNYEYKCRDCMVYRRGDCFGKMHLCDDFIASPNISRQEMDNWPSMGDASRYKARSRR